MAGVVGDVGISETANGVGGGGLGGNQSLDDPSVAFTTEFTVEYES